MKPHFYILAAATTLPFTMQCAEKSNFGGSAKTVEKSKNERPQDYTEGADTSTNNKLSGDTLSFSLDDKSDPDVDYVFVVDNSSSMRDLIKKVTTGFSNIVEDSVFPENARLSVMSTTVNESTSKNAKLVGFQQLVTKEQIKNSARKNLIKTQYPGCGAFFAPTEKDAAGNYCLVSAIQFKIEGTGIEAGITAFHRMVKDAEKPIFREDALVNVIFVSDTHDPGNGNVQLTNALKDRTFDSLKKEVQENSGIRGLKFHAIAPLNGQCSDEKTHGFSYHKLVDASGGSKKDCRTDQYASFLTDMAEKSIEEEEVSFKIPKNVKTVRKVDIDGDSIKFDFNEDKRSLTVSVDREDYPKDAKVEIKVELK